MTEIARPWNQAEPGYLMGKGHPAGDFLHAWDWRILEEREGYLRIDATVPQHVLNPRGQLFGGFTPAYVDLIALFTVRSGPDRLSRPHRWLATTNMRVDYLEPILGPRVLVTSQLLRQRSRMKWVQTHFLNEAGEAMVMALTTLRDIEASSPLGDG